MSQCDEKTPRVTAGDLPLLPRAKADSLAGFAKALSDPIRLNMLHLLEQRADLCTCEFEAILGLTQSKVSYHLKVLLDAGLVTRETHGTWSHYSLVQNGILAHLSRLCTMA